MLQVVCFDVGGVLIRITQKWQEAAKYAGVEISPSISDSALLTEAPLFEDFQSGRVDTGAYEDALANYLGIAPEDARRVHKHIMLEPYPGVDRVVDHLNSIGVLTACLSNTNEPHWDEMFFSGRFPANEKLRLRMGSHMVGKQKPDPAIFRRFEDECGFSESQILLLDDTVANLEAAQQLGWRTGLIDPAGNPAIQIEIALRELKLPG